jgi:hypothetical protein
MRIKFAAGARCTTSRARHRFASDTKTGCPKVPAAVSSESPTSTSNTRREGRTDHQANRSAIFAGSRQWNPRYERREIADRFDGVGVQP